MIKYDLVDPNQMGGVRCRVVPDTLSAFRVGPESTNERGGIRRRAVLPLDQPPVPTGGHAEARLSSKGDGLLWIIFTGSVHNIHVEQIHI